MSLGHFCTAMVILWAIEAVLFCWFYAMHRSHTAKAGSAETPPALPNRDPKR
jgi:hypothetical protein